MDGFIFGRYSDISNHNRRDFDTCHVSNNILLKELNYEYEFRRYEK